jgi:hypothetical protein
MELEMMPASAWRSVEGMISATMKTATTTMKAAGVKTAAPMKASAAMEAASTAVEATPATMETAAATAMAATATAASGRLRRITEHETREHESNGCAREDRGAHP